MEICTEHVEQIVFDGRYCPACSEIEELKGDITTLMDRIAKLEEEAE